MTYCLGLRVADGLVMLSDTRTNAGVDNIARFSKMFRWEIPGQSAVCLCTAGNLSITQGVVEALDRGIATEGAERPSIFLAPGMYEVAEIVGQQMVRLVGLHGPNLAAAGVSAASSLLVGGRVAGGPLRLFQIYDAGNFIEADADTPFLQIGEFKYGKPILDRVLTRDSPIADALKVAYLSMASTIRSNLSVSTPLDLSVMRDAVPGFADQRRIEEADADYRAIEQGWSTALLEAFHALPAVD